jgi:hypothetical protein
LIQLQDARQKELERQMQTIKTSLERAKIYNRILTNMQPQRKAAVSPALQAVNQEKIRLMHAEAGKLAAALPAKPASRAASSAIQAKQAAQIIPSAKTSAPRAETAAKTS